MKRRYVSLCLALLFLAIVPMNAYADARYDELLQSIQDTNEVIEAMKEDQRRREQELRDTMYRINNDWESFKQQQYSDFQELINTMDQIDTALQMDFERQKRLYRDLLITIEDINARVYKVPFEVHPTDGDAQQMQQLFKNIKNGLLDYAQVSITDGFIRYTFYSKTKVMINGKEYEVGEITVYNDNYANSESVKAELLSLNDHSYYEKAFGVKIGRTSPMPTNMKVQLNPVGDSGGAAITKDFRLNYNWKNAEKLYLTKPNDVKQEHWAYPYIVYNMTAGNFMADKSGNFLPDKVVVRGEFATAFGKMVGINANDYKGSSYSDVDVNEYYGTYVNWAKQSNLFHLDDASKFMPNKELTREEVAYILYTYIKMKDIKLNDVQFNGFSDEAEISDWAKEAVLFLAKKGIMQGTDGKFGPKQTFTRAQIAHILYKLKGFIN